MKILLSLALIPLLAVAARGQEPAANPGLTDLQQSDREFLNQLEKQGAPSPVAEGPVEAAAAAPSEPATAPVTAEKRPASPAPSSKRSTASKPKSNETMARKRISEERTPVRSRHVESPPVYVGFRIDVPTVVPLERRIRTVVRPIEVRRAIPVIKPFRIFNDRDDDDDEDDD